MDQEFPENEVIIETRDGLGLITLNRPKALNALSLDMIRQIATALHHWQSNDDVKAVVFMGTGDRAFCSGGDIKAFYSAGMDSRRGAVSPRVPLLFFAEEYSLNKQIFNYLKPTVSIMDGITMGGGYGIAGHCNVRICGDRTMMAMPEVIIGFFPDIGGMYHLNQCPHYYGRYMALTGDSVNGKQAVALGLGDIYLDDVNEDAVVSAVQGVLDEADFEAALKAALDGVVVSEPLPNAELIEKAFANTCVAEVIAALEDDGSEEAKDIIAVLRSVSPTSLKIVSECIRTVGGMSFDEVIAQDFILVQHFVKQSDMYEGIRARLIDKDNKPNWFPQGIEKIDEDAVKGYFTSTGYDLSDVEIF